MNLVDTFVEKVAEKGYDTEIQIKLLLDFIDTCTNANARDMERFLADNDDGDDIVIEEDKEDDDEAAMPLADDYERDDDYEEDDEDDDDDDDIVGRRSRF